LFGSFKLDYASPCQTSSKSVADILQFNSFSKWRLSVILDLDHPQRVLIVVQNLVGIHALVSLVGKFCVYGLKAPIHAPKILLSGEYDPLTGI